MKKLFAAATLGATLLFSQVTFAAPASAESVNLLLEKTKAASMGVDMMMEMVNDLSQAGAPPEFLQAVKDEIHPADLQALLVPIYQKHFTEEDIQEILKFYDSEVGQKMVDKMPDIMKDSMKEGEKWGEAIGERVVEKMMAQ